MITCDTASAWQDSYAKKYQDLRDTGYDRIQRVMYQIAYKACRAAALSAQYGRESALISTGNGSDLSLPYPEGPSL